MINLTQQLPLWPWFYPLIWDNDILEEVVLCNGNYDQYHLKWDNVFLVEFTLMNGGGDLKKRTS